METLKALADYGALGLISGALLYGAWTEVVWIRGKLLDSLDRNTTALVQVADVIRRCERDDGKGEAS